MSGHSKWATTKHRKGAKDQARAKVFAKLIRQVEVAAREGGGDMTANATLRTMFTKARDASVPIDTIERAIKRGTGELEGVRYEAISYEGYAPSGVALIVEVLTDNRNRTGADIRSIFSRNGGSMAEPGAVSWQFERKGVVMLPKTVGEDDLMTVAVDAGAEDLRDEGNDWMLTCAPGDLPTLLQALEAASIAIEAGDVEMVATTRVAV
ncbi:MAG: YebC/PmpR family DNA-binding transcriptional regulator, partial [Acidimicrobiales bacterium]